MAHKKPYRPGAEGSVALPRHAFGLDVIARIGRLRYTEYRSVPEIRAHLVGRGVTVSERAALADDRRLQKVLTGQGKVLLGIDGLQPDVGHEVPWVVRDCLSGEILRVRALRSARQSDRAELLAGVKAAGPVPVAGVVSDGQHSIRKAVRQVFPGVPYQLRQFHDLREAARPIDAADRHAKKELKKKVRAVRGVERRTEGRDDPEAEVIRGYCSAVRSTLTDDGRPPLEASGLKLHGRLCAIAGSLDRVGEKGAPGRTPGAEGGHPPRAGGDGRAVGVGAPGVRVGPPGGPRPRPGRGDRGGRPRAADRAARGDDTGPRPATWGPRSITSAR